MATNNCWNTKDPFFPTNGGTGNTSLTANAVLLGNAGVATTDTGAGTAGQILLATGASSNPAWVTPTAGTGITVTTNASTLNYGLTVPVSVANSGTGITSTTAYGPICAGTTTTGALQPLSAGQTGQVLCSQGSSQLPIWQDAELVKIATNTIASSTATTAFTSGIGSTYAHYYITFSGVQPVTTNTSFRMQVGTSGPTYVTTGYNGECVYTLYNSSSYSHGNSTTYIPISPGATASSTSYLSGSIWLMNLATASANVGVVGNVYAAGTNNQGFIYGTIAASSYVAIKFLFSSGNIALGTITLYGIVS